MADDDEPELTTSRLRRFGRMAWTSKAMIPLAWQRLRGTSQAADGSSMAGHEAAAAALLESLGALKGLALKAGQLLSYLHAVLPPELEPAYKQALAKLQRDVPARPWSEVERVLDSELGDARAEFLELDEQPFAAASIGQVHRATLRTGEAVAVKVQYPGIDAAVAADLANLDLMQGFLRPIFATLGASQNARFARGIVHEIRDRVLEELDYEREARMQQRFTEFFADVPSVLIPRVFETVSSRRVLTTAFERGMPLESAAQAPEALRDAWGEALLTVALRGMLELGLFHADPHPGNYLFREADALNAPSSRVVFFDFGCVKELSAETLRGMSACLRAAIEATDAAGSTDAPAAAERFDERLSETLRLDRGSPEVAAFYRAVCHHVFRPLVSKEPFTFTRAYTSELNELMVSAKREMMFGGGRRLPKVPKIPELPSDFVFLSRLQWGLYSVLAELEATVDCRRLVVGALQRVGGESDVDQP